MGLPTTGCHCSEEILVADLADLSIKAYHDIDDVCVRAVLGDECEFLLNLSRKS